MFCNLAPPALDFVKSTFSCAAANIFRFGWREILWKLYFGQFPALRSFERVGYNWANFPQLMEVYRLAEMKWTALCQQYPVIQILAPSVSVSEALPIAQFHYEAHFWRNAQISIFLRFWFINQIYDTNSMPQNRVRRVFFHWNGDLDRVPINPNNIFMIRQLLMYFQGYFQLSNKQIFVHGASLCTPSNQSSQSEINNTPLLKTSMFRSLSSYKTISPWKFSQCTHN